MSRPCDRPVVRAVMPCNRAGKCQQWRRGTPAGECPLGLEAARSTYAAQKMPAHKVEGLDEVMAGIFESFPEAKIVELKLNQENI